MAIAFQGISLTRHMFDAFQDTLLFILTGIGLQQLYFFVDCHWCDAYFTFLFF